MANFNIVLGSDANLAVKKNYVYQDINAPFIFNDNITDIKVNRDVDAIFGSLRNIFTYTPGERMLKPDFGIDIHKLLYEPMNDKTAQSIGMLVYNAITKWEKRIKITNINVNPDYDDNTYYIIVSFTINAIANAEVQQFKHAYKRTL